MRKLFAGFFTAALLCQFINLNAEESKCFLRKGDRWKIMGDSITHNNTYVRTVSRVLNHFHPNSTIEINGLGVNGVASNYKYSDKSTNETVVSIMLGTNDVIHHIYKKIDKEALLKKYEKVTSERVESYRKRGVTVLLLSSPLTDERYGRGFFETRGTNDIIKEFPRILKKIAAETGSYYIPVQEELEIYRKSVEAEHGIIRPLLADGVHPTGWAQYQIARTLWEHLNFPGQLLNDKEKRELSPAFIPVPVKVTLNSRFMTAGETLKLTFKSATVQKVKLSWSYGKKSGKSDLDVSTNGTDWTVPLTASDFNLTPGENKELVFDLTSGEKRSLYILDLSSTRLWHFDKNNTIHGTIPLDAKNQDRTWEIQKIKDGLMISGTMVDKDIQEDAYWYFQRDGIQILLDLRPEDRFLNLSIDEDCHLFFLTVQEEPRVGVGIVPVFGRGLNYASNAGVEKTKDGYKWHVVIKHGFQDRGQNAGLDKNDFIGFYINTQERDLDKNGKPHNQYFSIDKTDYPFYSNTHLLQTIDVKNRFKSDKVTVLNLWGL
jgi:lysophospholipase L1-like esterase